MVKHNNIIPNQHFHKQWQKHVRTWFDQPMRKKRRRMKRKEKAAMMAPRPTQLLRPVVHCQTIKYNNRERVGRGFTLAELKEAGINRKEALGIGIAVDHRRTNSSVEAFQANVRRLKEYRSKLIIFPRRRCKAKAGDSTKEECAVATQVTGVINAPAQSRKVKVETMEMTEAMITSKTYMSLRQERCNARMVGKRHIAKLKAAEEAARKAKKKAKGK